MREAPACSYINVAITTPLTRSWVVSVARPILWMNSSNRGGTHFDAAAEAVCILWVSAILLAIIAPKPRAVTISAAVATILWVSLHWQITQRITAANWAAARLLPHCILKRRKYSTLKTCALQVNDAPSGKSLFHILWLSHWISLSDASVVYLG